MMFGYLFGCLDPGDRYTSYVVNWPHPFLPMCSAPEVKGSGRDYIIMYVLVGVLQVLLSETTLPFVVSFLPVVGH